MKENPVPCGLNPLVDCLGAQECPMYPYVTPYAPFLLRIRERLAAEPERELVHILGQSVQASGKSGGNPLTCERYKKAVSGKTTPSL